MHVSRTYSAAKNRTGCVALYSAGKSGGDSGSNSTIRSRSSLNPAPSTAETASASSPALRRSLS